jgi:hypothetical protein
VARLLRGQLILALPLLCGSASGWWSARAPEGQRQECGAASPHHPVLRQAGVPADKIRGLADDWDSDWDGGFGQYLQPRENWVDVPFPLDLMPGETKHDFCARLRPSFLNVTDDQFRFMFYEQYWPEYKAGKRLRARLRGCGLRAHVARAFELDDAEEGRVPYEGEAMEMLGEHHNLTALVQSTIPLSEIVDTSHQPQAQHCLWRACQDGLDDETIFRLASAANVDARCESRSNFTAMHFAAERGHLSVVEVLIALRANLTIRDGNDMTAADVALSQRHGRVAAVMQLALEVDRLNIRPDALGDGAPNQAAEADPDRYQIVGTGVP